MKKWICRIILLLLAVVFVCSIIQLAIIFHQYRENDKHYEAIADKFTQTAVAGTEKPGEQDGSGETEAGEPEAGQPETGQETVPVIVDFAGLKEVNEDIIGWLYCEGTVINYPVLQGDDNDQYLRNSYDGTHSSAGSIFVEELNRRDFEDFNTIIYGHHMKNGSMFAVLDKWADQEFYESHPVMWLLTPEQDYRIDLFSGYTTSAYSDTYTIFTGPGKELDDYLAACVGRSYFQADVELDRESRYVVLSTCAYAFDNARTVLHGKLVPVDSAGGKER